MHLQAFLLAMTGLATAAAAADPVPLSYPPTARGTIVDHPFGLAIPDPYRWLEADVRTDPKVRAWVDAESRFTDKYLSALPGRAAIARRLTQLWNYERMGVPRARGDLLFFQRNAGLQNQSPLYVQGAEGQARVLLDPNGWSTDSATALAEWEPSDDGRHVAYAIQDGGSDWRTIRVADVATGQVLPDMIEWAKYTSIAWAHDGAGFFYARFDKPTDAHVYQAGTLDQRIMFHRLGTPQSADRLVYATPDRPRLTHGVQVSDDGRWLVILSTENDTSTELAVQDLAQPGSRPRILIPYGDHDIGFVGNRGDRLFLTTDEGASRKRIVAVDGTGAAGARAWEEVVVPEQAGTIDGASLVGDRLIVTLMEDARNIVRRFTLDGRVEGAVALPGIGAVGGFESRAGSAVTYFSFASFNQPGTIYRYDAAADRATLFRKPEVAFDPAGYEVSQIFYRSKDGTRVPMFIAHKKGLDLSRPQPTLLYAYGGFNIPVLPSFSVARLQWMEMGGVFALANIRGGGEYGKAWHDGGKGANKQNVFDDFIAAAEWLEANGITSKDKLAIQGGSNGGLLVGAVTNQRPDLFAAAIPQVGVMDMTRFTNFTAGRFWTGDFGDPTREADLKTVLAYSPYHNIRGGQAYPAILATTADTDDRVVPGHSFKYAAALQAADIGPKPHLIRIETRAGHGSGMPTDKQIAEYADLWAFAAKWTGLTPPAE